MHAHSESRESISGLRIVVIAVHGTLEYPPLCKLSDTTDPLCIFHLLIALPSPGWLRITEKVGWRLWFKGVRNLRNVVISQPVSFRHLSVCSTVATSLRRPSNPGPPDARREFRKNQPFSSRRNRLPGVVEAAQRFPVCSGSSANRRQFSVLQQLLMSIPQWIGPLAHSLATATRPRR
jgi:hypothetical protein